VFNEGYSGDVDLAAEAIRIARQLVATTYDAEVAGLLALFLLHHARRPARTRAEGSLVPRLVKVVDVRGQRRVRCVRRAGRGRGRH
jgi:predicted RNA polymerase sigma factor